MLTGAMEMVVTYIPRIIWAIAVLAAGWIIGRVAALILKRIVGRVGLESAFRRTSVGRAILRSGYTPSDFSAAIAKGVVYLFAVLAALNALSIPTLTTAVQTFLEYLPSFVEGVLILVAGLVFADWVGESIEKGSFSVIQPTLLGGLIRVLLYFVTVTIALTHMQIDVTVLYIFAQALAWGLALALGIMIGWHLKNKIGPLLEKTLEPKRTHDSA